MFVINISDAESRSYALYLLELYDCTFQIERFKDKLRYTVYSQFDDGAVIFNNENYHLCEMAFINRWLHKVAGACWHCELIGKRHCSHLTFTYPKEEG